jgi:hypothetical protein
MTTSRRKDMLPIFFLTDFSCGSWDSQLDYRVVARPCEASSELDFYGLCVAPL